MLPLVRTWVVRYTSARYSRMRYAQPIFIVAGPTVCLIVPIAVVAGPAIRSLSSEEVFLALLVYFSIFGLVATCFFGWVGSQLLALLAVFVTGASIVLASIVALLVAHPLKASQFGVLASILAVLAIMVCYLGNFGGPYIWFPIMRRRLASLSPSLATAVLLWYLADHVDAALATWRQVKTRRNLLYEIQSTSYWFTVRMPRAMWMAGYRGPAYSEARRCYQRAGSFVQDQAWRMMDANDRTSLTAIRDDLMKIALAVAKEDWAVLPPPQKRTSRSWLFALARRIIVAIVLAGVAVLLPHLPDVRLTGSALTSLQAALFVAAILSLTPVDASSRERVISAFTDPGDRH